MPVSESFVLFCRAFMWLTHRAGAALMAFSASSGNERRLPPATCHDREFVYPAKKSFERVASWEYRACAPVLFNLIPDDLFQRLRLGSVAVALATVGIDAIRRLEAVVKDVIDIIPMIRCRPDTRGFFQRLKFRSSERDRASRRTGRREIRSDYLAGRSERGRYAAPRGAWRRAPAVAPRRLAWV